MNNTFKLAAVSSAALMLAAAPALAEGPTLKLGGYYDQKISTQSQSTNIQSDIDVRNDVEIYFLGSAKLDNGISIKTRVELEGGTDGSADIAADGGNAVNGGGTTFDQIDEAFMTISGSFGSLKLGMSDTAAKGMTTGLQGTWASNVGENISFNTGKLFVKPGTVTTRPTPAAQMDLNSDGEQISYTTPSMGGFQVSVGYARLARETFDGVDQASGVDSNIFDVGVRYMGKVGDAAIKVGGGYASANDKTIGAENDGQWMVGGSTKMGNFQVAASFSRQMETKLAGVTDVVGIDTVEFGARAWMGPNQFSIAYTRSKSDSTVAAANGDTEMVIAAAMRRKLGAGVSWHNTIFYYDADDGDSAPAAGDITGNDGWAFTTGIQLSF
jgi:outer membrane protein OmpU